MNPKRLILLLAVMAVLLGSALFWWRSSKLTVIKEGTAQAACQKITLSEMKSYCLALVAKDPSLCLKMEDEDKYSCQAIVSDEASFCQKITRQEEKRICIFEIARLNRKIDYCDALGNQDLKEGCYFGYFSGFHWEGRNNLILDSDCQKFPVNAPERRTCQASQKNNVTLCGGNPNCVRMYYTDENTCQTLGNSESQECYRSVALLTKNPQICQKIIDAKGRDDCLFDYVGHAGADTALCGQLSEKFLQQECYKNAAISLSGLY